MSDIVLKTTQKLSKKSKSIAEFNTGDTVGVHVRVREGDKERVQLYKGVVLKIQGKGVARSFTSRHSRSYLKLEFVN